MRIKKRIILLNVIAFTIIVVITTSIDYLYTASIFTKSMNKKNQVNADLIASQIDDWLQNQIATIEQMIDVIKYLDIADYNSVTPFLVNLNKQNPPNDFAVFFETGVFANGQNWLPPPEYNPRERPWYVQSIGSESVIVTAPYLSTSVPDNIAFAIVKRFTAKTGLNGVAFTEIRVSTLLSLIEQFQADSGAYAFLIDSQYRILSHPHSAYRMKDSGYTALREINGGEDFLKEISFRSFSPLDEIVPISVYDYDNISRYFFFAKSKISNWIIAFALPAEELNRMFTNIRIRSILICFILIMVVSVASVIIAVKLASPIEEITTTLESAVKTNNFVSLDGLGKSNYELAKIAKSFNAVMRKNSQEAMETGKININGNMPGITRKLREIMMILKPVESVYILYFDIDKFKTINKIWGYYAGNELIDHVFNIILNFIKEKQLPEKDFMHVVGDEFAVFYKGKKEEACAFAADIIDRVSKTGFVWNDKNITVCISVGIVPINVKVQNEQDILVSAYEACSLAFRSGGNCYKLLSNVDSMIFTTRNISFWLNTIQKALKDNRFLLYKQAIVPLNDIVPAPKYEILVRLQTEDGQVIMPDTFVPIAERYNMIYEIDRWVIKTSFRCFAEMQKKNSPDSRAMFSINISADSFFSNDLIEFICKTRAEYDVPAHNFCFELTESCAVRNLDATSRFVTELRKQGFSFALDDFGKGFSSFPYLKTLPIDYVKIDGSFIKSIDKDYIDFSMVKTMRDMCYHLGLYTIGEYAEDEQIVTILKDIGIDYGQGYAFQKPIPLMD